MKYKNRKKLQRAFNKELRNTNKGIREDNLWLGRFEARQIYARYEHYDDNSGGILYAVVRVIDKASGYYKDYNVDIFTVSRKFYAWHLWEAINKFITEDALVWTKDGRPKPVNYLNKKVPDEVWNKPFNWHVAEEYWDNGKNIW